MLDLSYFHQLGSCCYETYDNAAAHLQGAVQVKL